MARSGRSYPNTAIIVRGGDASQTISVSGIGTAEAFGTATLGLKVLPPSIPRIVVETLKTSDGRTTSQDLTLGSDSAVGDTLVVSYCSDFFDLASMPDITSTAGTASLVTSADLGTNVGHMKLYTIVVDTPGAQTVTIPAHSGCDIHGIVMRLEGTYTVDVSGSNVWNGVTTSSSHVAPSVTATNPGEFLVCTWMQDGGGSWSGNQYVVPGSMTFRAETDSSPFSASAMATELLSSAGATETRTATWPPATAKWGGISVALIPPAPEQFGTPTLTYSIHPSSIASAEAFGSVAVTTHQTVTVTGIGSAEAFGSVTLQLGYPQTILPSGIASVGAFGDPTVENTMIWVLRPDSVQETPAGEDRLTIRYGIHRAISIVKRQDSSYYSTRYPAQTELEEAALFYMGGHIYVVSNSEAAALTAAGYGSLLTLEPA